jgi:tRNA A37 methylthiotransferase MiaB
MTVVKKKAKAHPKEMPLDRQEELAEARYQYAYAIKEFQDAATQVAVNRMVSQMAHMASPLVHTDPKVLERMKRVQYYNQTYIAIRLLVACAKWDIKIANFQLPNDRCADCGERV